MGAKGSVEVQVREILETYNKEVKVATENAARKTARKAASMLRATSPRMKGGKKSGKYAKGWTFKKLDENTIVVYNRTDYMLTHLLEFGHAVHNQYGATGKRAGAQPHIKPVEEWAIEAFPEKIEQELR